MGNGEVKKLLGQEFKVVKRGLAEEQVMAFINQLIDQRDKLLAKQQHINSLQILAEKTVTEANELAEQIRCEAQSEAGGIIEEARERAKEIFEETQRQAQAEAQEKVNRVLAQARQEASSIVEVTKRQVSSEIKAIGERFMPGFKDLSAQTVNSKDAAGTRDRLKPEKVKGELDTKPTPVFSGIQRVAEKRRITEPTKESSALPGSLTDSPVFQGEAKIAVVPPVDTAQFSRLRKKLEDVLYLKVLRTDGSWGEGYIITARIYQPMPLISMLRGMAEVERAQLWTDGGRWSDGYFPGWLALEPKPGGLKGDRVVVKLRRGQVPG